MSAPSETPLRTSQVYRDLSKWYRGFIQGKTRAFLAWIFAISLALSARIPLHFAGVFLCFLGAALRFWASGFLRKDVRPAVGGPYAHVRNPLYLGTFMMAIGTAWAAGSFVLMTSGFILFLAIYQFIIEDEEVKLRVLFGDSYRAYCQIVPRFFPSLIPASRQFLDEVNPEREHRKFSMELALKNKAYEAFAAFFGLMTSVVALSKLWYYFLGN